MNKNSPFQDWLDANTQGYAFSQEIRMWMAKAYEGGYLAGSQATMEAKVTRFIGAHMKPWVGLTDAEVMEMMGYDKQYGHIPQYARNFVEAITAKLKEKNS